MALRTDFLGMGLRGGAVLRVRRVVLLANQWCNSWTRRHSGWSSSQPPEMGGMIATSSPSWSLTSAPVAIVTPRKVIAFEV